MAQTLRVYWKVHKLLYNVQHGLNRHCTHHPQNPVDSMFGPAPGRGRGAPGFGAPASPHELMFGLGKEQGGLGRLGLGLGEGQSRLLQGHAHTQGLGEGFASKDWQVAASLLHFHLHFLRFPSPQPLALLFHHLHPPLLSTSPSPSRTVCERSFQT